MHPAWSVIVFTVLSGFGFGYLAWLGIGIPAVTGWAAFWSYLIAFGLAVTGLVASTFHLGNPQRALLAFTQWRTSWLSREACLAVGALSTMGLYALMAVFFGQIVAPLGWLGAILCVATIVATAMIYMQLETVPRWNHWITPVHFLLIALSGGAVLAAQGLVAIALILVSGGVQLAAWIGGDKRFKERGHTMETATGLGNIGTVNMFEPPHTGSNYLMKEMVHIVGRKHAHKLRIIALLLATGAPVVILLFLPSGIVAATLAGLVLLVGTFASRWLFFAEAEHVVGLYYGRKP